MGLNFIKRVFVLLKWAYRRRNTSVILDACAVYDLAHKKDRSYVLLQALTFLRRKSILLPGAICQQVKRKSEKNDDISKSELFNDGQTLIEEIISKKKGIKVGSQKTGLVNCLGHKSIGSLNLSKEDLSFCRREYKKQVKKILARLKQGTEIDFNFDVDLDDDFLNPTLKRLLGTTDLRVIASALVLQQADKKCKRRQNHEYIIITRDRMLAIVAQALGVKTIKKILDL
ncbi:MAG: hypothetical protein KAS12_04980 [Candidatus Aenigmarchaeota archaeon]|nr:hypothetical protein [Candidatus Aenigmarchaeota archaeon]